MTGPVVVRPERPDDEAAVRQLVVDAFADEALGVLLDDLRASVAWLDLSFVAERDGELVGHVAFSRAWVDDPGELVEVLVLSPMSIRPDAQGSGVGTLLIVEAVAQLAGRDEPLVFLEGDPAFYSRVGFVEAGPLGFTAPSRRIPREAFQVRPLPGRPGFVSGALIYPDIWWRHDAVGLRSAD